MKTAYTYGFCLSNSKKSVYTSSVSRGKTLVRFTKKVCFSKGRTLNHERTVSNGFV